MSLNLLQDGFNGLGRLKVLMSGVIRKELSMAGYRKIRRRESMVINVGIHEG